MKVKAKFTFCRNVGLASDFYYQKGSFIISAGQSVVSGIAVGMNRASVINMGFRRDEEGGSGGVFVK
ncbi:MAG: hypothetical protein PHC35_03370 [Deltaproteobacteria bacterium]|nr:hypothetical protein [Deltaproteobacteria bacterium]